LKPLAASWTITAGVLPDQPIEDYTKIFRYTIDDYGSDQYGTTLFHDTADKAFDYAKTIGNPGVVNWVNVDFIWY
jgi:hypothetical protein